VARLSAGDNATHKYFNASHMLGSTAHESIHQVKSVMAKMQSKLNEDSYDSSEESQIREKISRFSLILLEIYVDSSICNYETLITITKKIYNKLMIKINFLKNK